MFVAVTSPLLLLPELFTIRGAGTLIKRGSPILVKRGFADLDQARVASLLQSSFGRDLTPGFFDRDIARVYVEENYRGAALVRETPLGAYLCKLAVEREAQGEGLGRDLWQLVVSDYKSLFWRARPDNAILPFISRSATAWPGPANGTCSGRVSTWRASPGDRHGGRAAGRFRVRVNSGEFRTLPYLSSRTTKSAGDRRKRRATSPGRPSWAAGATFMSSTARTCYRERRYLRPALTLGDLV